MRRVQADGLHTPRPPPTRNLQVTGSEPRAEGPHGGSARRGPAKGLHHRMAPPGRFPSLDDEPLLSPGSKMTFTVTPHGVGASGNYRYGRSHDHSCGEAVQRVEDANRGQGGPCRTWDSLGMHFLPRLRLLVCKRRRACQAHGAVSKHCPPEMPGRKPVLCPPQLPSHLLGGQRRKNREQKSK